ncbi:hypothetical protein [Microterricola viridarii]|uniref:Uncharacterized protein n=1 Tax=Microterricola viridarii TaxID=412690 RepID=A0A1H1TMZ4_9MICO|nr:hypothetical protein [Microterricola viridarii]SDS61608.1 hypothetical protein SAMN04489834_1807 [Microterricola viridarii]
MPDQAAQPPEGLSAASAPVRAQLLATEHWSLLASRSTTQSEVLTRISIFLTLTSASLLSIALVGQASTFNADFRLFAVVILGVLCVIGTLTNVRVLNVAHEDLMYVLAMNRLRAAYLALDPGIEPYLMASSHDDQAGSQQTYYWLGRRSDFSHVIGSSMIFIAAVCAALTGLFAAALGGLLGAPPWALYLLGFGVGLAYLGISAGLGGRGYFRVWRDVHPVSPTPGAAR